MFTHLHQRQSRLHRPSATVTNGGVTESYLYDADGERVAKTVGGVTTVFFQGVWEQTVGGASKLSYTFNGQVVAMRDTGTNAVTYLHGDHLGSVSLATNSSGAVVSRQDFDPWGKARGTNTIPQTSLNYTGQRLDGTGLLYYHARYYDPTLARFVSADTVVPGSASGGMDGVALKGLTVDFHEPGFVSTLGQENGYGFWFQMSDEQRQQAGSPWGPANPQALDRYSYVQNNPLRYDDLSGHCPMCLVIPFLVISAPAWVVPVAIGIAVVGVAAVVAYAVVQVAHKVDTTEESQEIPENSLDDYPANPDDWKAPEGWTETSAGEKTGGAHRQWKGPNGELRRWDRDGSDVQPGLGPHWHDPRSPGKHILPTR